MHYYTSILKITTTIIIIAIVIVIDMTMGEVKFH